MTREEAIKALREILTEATEFENSVCYVTEEDREPLEMAIKALEQEPVIDKIKAEIEKQKKEYCFDANDMFAYRTGLDDALYILDKYKAESEVSDADSD